MNIVFREVDPFNCWIWIRFSESPTQDEKNYLDGVFDSWYVLGLSLIHIPSPRD